MYYNCFSIVNILIIVLQLLRFIVLYIYTKQTFLKQNGKNNQNSNQTFIPNTSKKCGSMLIEEMTIAGA